jgi:hypothetical protein
VASFRVAPAPPVLGAPYWATINEQSVQTLADGNRIVQTFTGTTARDSQGRTRQDTPLPVLGNLAAADRPQVVFITDPLSQSSYTLDLTNKTAQRMTASAVGDAGPGPATGGPALGSAKFFVHAESGGVGGGALPPLPLLQVFLGDENGT